jgi:hypothetical protein
LNGRNMQPFFNVGLMLSEALESTKKIK